MNIFDTLLYEPIYNLTIVFYRLLGGNLGLAIIAIGLLFRFIMFPFTLKQIENAEKSKELMEKTKQIKEKYKNNKEKQQQELVKVQSEYLPGQLAGCLPTILQIILFLQIYRVISSITSITEGSLSAFNNIAYSFVPKLEQGELNTNFFGIIDLHRSAGSLDFFSLEIIPYLILIALMALTQYLSMNILSGNKKKDQKEEKKLSNKDVPEDFGEIVQQSSQQAMMIMPIMLAFAAYNFASGLSLYWTVQSGFVIIQQFVIQEIKKRSNSKNSN